MNGVKTPGRRFEGRKAERLVVPTAPNNLLARHREAANSQTVKEAQRFGNSAQKLRQQRLRIDRLTHPPNLKVQKRLVLRPQPHGGNGLASFDHIAFRHQ